jgi:1-acyl-sn-glycerol-3-phosphate acyltransferase
MWLTLKALGRMLQFVMHLFWGMALALWLQLQLGEEWHQQPRGRATICRWLRQLAHILGLHTHLSCDRVTNTGPVLLVANHISWLEIVAIGSLRPIRFLAKDDVRSWPLIGTLVALGGTLFIHRHSNSALRRTQADLAQALGAGQNVLIFPEGTTTDGSRVERFRPALFEAARSARRPIQPVAISYRCGSAPDPIAPFIGDDGFVQHLWRILRRADTHLYLHFCEPLDSGEMRQALAHSSRECISAALAATPPQAAESEDCDAIQNGRCARIDTPR